MSIAQAGIPWLTRLPRQTPEQRLAIRLRTERLNRGLTLDGMVQLLSASDWQTDASNLSRKERGLDRKSVV